MSSRSNLRTRFLYSQAKLKSLSSEYIKELTNAKVDKDSSVSYLKNPINKNQFVEEGELFQVIVMGGTNAVTVLAQTRNSQISLLDKKDLSMPQFDTKETFVHFIAENLDPNVNNLAINFGFPLHADGTLIKGVKDHVFKGLAGQNISEVLASAVKEDDGRELEVMIANDTVCLTYSDPKADISMVLGTGFNIGLVDGDEIINTESGAFSSKPLTTNTGKIVNEMSEQPGTNVFEKEISGGYLHQHYGLLKDEFNLEGLDPFTTEALSVLAGQEEQSRESQIAQILFERSASLVAMQMAGLYKFMGKQKLHVVVEGSVFWKAWNYQNLVNKYTEKLGVPKNSITYTEVKDSSLVGGARLMVGRK